MEKRPIKALLFVLLAVLFLLNTRTVMAAETNEVTPAEPFVVTEAVTDSAPSEPPPLVWLEVDTFEQLHEALEMPTPSQTTRIRLTSNITVPAIEDECTSNLVNLIELDFGPYTLYVEGTLRLQSGVTLMGSTGEEAMIRVRPGGEANINNVIVQAGERCAVWQEEGAIFTASDPDVFAGKVHYADRAVAMPYSFISWQVAMPVAVVHDGQTLADVLPEADNVQLTYSGECDIDAYIPVSWDTDDFRERLDSRTRTVITGSYPDAIALQQPVCLVVFQNGNPAIFLDAYGMDSSGQPKAKVKIELMEPGLGCRFEWSQDGKSWLPANVTETPSSDGRLAFTISFPQDTPPAYPYYLSAVVDYPDGGTGYSDVIIIEGADAQCGSGGNRHGGIGVTPPELPPLGGGIEGGGGTGGVAPDNPNGSVKPEDTEPPGGTEDSDGTHPPIGGAGSGQLVPLTQPPGQLVPPAVSEPPPAVEPASPHTSQTRDGTAASTENFAYPEPSQSISPTTSDGASSPQTTAGVQEAMTQTETKTPVPEGSAPNAEVVAQVAAGVVATGGIITLTMTWGNWSNRLIGLLRKLLKR